MAELNSLAPNIQNALAPSAISSQSNPYVESLLRQATKEYPFITQHNPNVDTGVGPYYAETWPVNEEGAPNAKRPANFPIDRLGIRVYKPNQFTAHDLAGEVLHVDPFANETRATLTKSLTPAQIQMLQQQSKDYQSSLDEGQSTDRAIQNATDATMRGYVLNQWPTKANESMNYDITQKALLERLKNYMKTGKQ
jgi:hypothetical protein